MSGEIIRVDDPTSHGGRVIEGSLTDTCHGKAISSIGHLTYCPKCKGTFPIIEGVATTTFFGKGVALAGMKTACGAILIATQFTDTVEVSSPKRELAPSARQPIRECDVAHSEPTASSVDVQGFDIFFHVKDIQTGKSLPNVRYRITVDDGQTVEGFTDLNGHTKFVASDKPSWDGDVVIRDAAGKSTDITTLPRSGMNPKIIGVGASFGVIKYFDGDKDKPHWSTTSR